MSARIHRSALVLVIALGAAGCADDRDPCGEVGVLCTIAGTGESGFEIPAVAGVPAVEQTLYLPVDVAADPDGKLVVVDFGNSCFRELDRATGTMRRIIGKGDIGFGCPDGGLECDALDFALNHASSITFDGDDAVVAGFFNSVVLRIHRQTGAVTEVYGAGTRGEYTGDGGPAVDAAFGLPTAVAVDDDGGILVLDQENQVVRRIDPDGTIARVAGNCLIDDPYVSPCAAGQEPVACEESEKLTCGDPARGCFEPCSAGYSGDGGPALEARFGLATGTQVLPSRITRGPSGSLLIADTLNHRIRQIDDDGRVTTVAGTGEAGAGPGQLNRPVDVAVGPDGALYIADSWNDCVQAIRPGGELAPVAGRCGEPGYAGDGGPATDALLDQPLGVEVADGVLYIADTANHVVRAMRIE
ncbi:MAG TPA: hypothetical protein VK698_35905 [Kofleriaceae bacterium]|nr:hypothetical protein [Kofleriaceae bacterium]